MCRVQKKKKGGSTVNTKLEHIAHNRDRHSILFSDLSRLRRYTFVCASQLYIRV